MKFNINISSLTILALLSSPALTHAAPDSTISTQRVNIYQDYTPEVKIAPKPQLTPSDLNIQNVQQPNFNYTVPQQSIRYTYGSVGIKPLALKHLSSPVSYQNYVAAGLGNLTTILADAGLTYYKEGAYDAYVHGYHFSQAKGDIYDRQSSFTEISGGGKYYLNQYVINADAAITRRAQTAYGYDHERFILDKKDIRHNLFNIGFNAGVDNIQLPYNQLTFQPQLGLNVLNGYNDANEMIIKLKAPVSYKFDSNIRLGVEVASEIDFYNHSWMDNDESHKTNGFLSIEPSATYTQERLYAKVGLKPTFSTDNNFKILPDVQVRYSLGTPANFSLSAGIKGDVEMYSFKNLSDKNPFVYNPVNSNAIHHQFYAGAEYAMLSNLKLEASAKYHTFNRYATFQNNFEADPTGRYFKINYIENTKVFEFNGGAHVLIANKFDLGANIAFYNFKNTVGIAYHEPNLHLKSYMKVRPIPQLLVGAQLDVMTGIKYLDENGMRGSLPEIFNLSGSAQYDIKDRYAVFVNLDNILNSKYQRWNQYNVYGFNIFAGFKFKF